MQEFNLNISYDEIYRIIAYCLLGISISGIGYIWKKVQTIFAGKFDRDSRIVNRSEIDSKAKWKRLIFNIIGQSLIFLGVYSRDGIIYSIPIIIGSAISIVNIALSHEYEIGGMYANGIIYRNKLHKWKNITLIEKNEDFEQIRLNNGTQLYIYEK